MGMFDEILLDVNFLSTIDDDRAREFVAAAKRNEVDSVTFQTKSLECLLDVYSLEYTDKGYSLRLAKNEYRQVETPGKFPGFYNERVSSTLTPVNFTGTIHCYGDVGNMDEDVDIDLSMLFIEGYVTSVTVTDFTVKAGDTRMRRVQAYQADVIRKEKYLATKEGKVCAFLGRKIIFISKIFLSASKVLNNLKSGLFKLSMKLNRLANKVTFFRLK